MHKLGLYLILLTAMSAEARPGGGGGGFSAGGRAGGSFGAGRSYSAPSVTRSAPSVGSGGGSNRGPGNGGGSGSYGRMGGSASGTLATPAYRNSEIRVIPRAAKLGAAAAAVGAAAYVGTHAGPQIAESLTHAMNAAAQNRSHFAPSPSLATARTAYARDEGYVQPTFTQMVLNPLYFWLPFNVWHPHPRSSTAAAASARTPDELGTFTGQHYRQGDVGSDELNQLPAWVQASLRLMHGKDQQARPVLPALPPVALTAEAWEAEQRPLLAELETWLARDRDAKEAANMSRQLETLRAREPQFAQVIAIGEERRKAALAELSQARAQIETGTERARVARRDLMWAKEDGWCHTWPYLFCQTAHLSGLRKAADAATRDAEVALYQSARAEYALRDADSALRLANERAANAKSEVKALDARLQSTQPALPPAAEIEAGLARARQALRNHEGLYRSTATVPGCDSLYAYGYDRKEIALKNPVFTEAVATDLCPRGAELAVCLNGDQITGVYILDGREVSYRSVIGRDENGAVNQIEIYDGEGKSLETHRWVSTDTGRLRYLLTFITDEDQKTSIYADIPSDVH